jgi:tRNA (cmo5U34)-methyltransferase
MINTGKRDFDKDAATWDDNPARIELAQAVAAAILRQVPVSNDMTMLDYGAGTGLVTLALQPHVRDVEAADSSQAMLAKLSEKALASGSTSVKTTFMDLENDAIPGQRYDLIVSSMTLHHIEDVSGIISCLHTMLKPGGYLAVADLDLDDGEFHPDPTGVKHNGLDRSEIARLFAETGFDGVASSTAHIISKPVADKGMRDFPVFLVSGRKA